MRRSRSLRDKFNNDPGECIRAWWRDQSADVEQSMSAFDKLSPELREAINNYRLNVLPETVQQAVKIWGETTIVEFLKTIA